MAEPIRILLVDDHAVLRAGLRALLEAEPGLAVVGEVGTGEEGIELAARHRPDVVIMDLSMPGMGGLEATRQIVAATPGTRVLVLTMHGEEEHLLPVLEAGGSGYVNKRSADEELIEAIRTVARGEVFLYPSAAKLLLQGFKGKEKGPEDPLGKLTEREREVLGLIARGHSNTEIAERLFLSPKTVRNHISSIFDKLQVTDRAQAIVRAREAGMGH